jgi:hypothetical protein
MATPSDGLKNALNGERMQLARQTLMGTAPPRSDIPCIVRLLQAHRRNRELARPVRLSVRGKISPSP